MLTPSDIKTLARVIENTRIGGFIDITCSHTSDYLAEIHPFPKKTDSPTALGSAMLLFAMTQFSFDIARYLVEHLQVDPTPIKAILESQKEFTICTSFLLFVRSLENLKSWQATHDTHNQQDYYNYIVKTAILNNDLDELQYINNINSNIILHYRDETTDLNACQMALISASFEIFKFFYETPSLTSLVEALDQNANSILHLAVIHNKADIINWLDALYSIDQINNTGKNIFHLAAEHQRWELLKYLYIKHDKTTLDILPLEITESTLFSDDDINMKGLVLMVHYFCQKNPYEKNVFWVQDHGDNPADLLADLLNKFALSSNTNMFLYHDNSYHRTIYKCEKYEKKIHIIAIDSVMDPNWSTPKNLLAIMADKHPDTFAKMVFYKNNMRYKQQTSLSGCRYYALKNLSLLMKTPSFANELNTNNHITKEDVKYGIFIRTYNLPARFMHLANHPNHLQGYILNNPDESKRILRTKNGKPQTLFDYAYQNRNKYGTETPEIVANLKYIPGADKQTEPQTILKNNSMEYFKNKYMRHIIPRLLNNLSQTQLKQIITFYDARNIEINNVTKKLYNTKISACFKSIATARNPFFLISMPTSKTGNSTEPAYPKLLLQQI